MILKDLIEFLESKDPSIVVPIGFANPHSYRGYYEQLAFEPVPNVRVSEMLSSAKEALGSSYSGRKGGEYLMDEYTDVNLAFRGETGETIGHTLLGYMVGETTLSNVTKTCPQCASELYRSINYSEDGEEWCRDCQYNN